MGLDDLRPPGQPAKARVGMHVGLLSKQQVHRLCDVLGVGGHARGGVASGPWR